MTETKSRFEVKTRIIHDTRGDPAFSRGDVTNKPCPAITVGPGGINRYHFMVEYYMTDEPPMMEETPSTKPPYRVPTMAEIAAIPWNGFNAISTFSGGGGSSTGYKMAGFRVLWANEFVEAAAETYRANHPNTILDTRDIRTIDPDEILESVGLKVGELDLFDGSPPCASFSTAGKREKGWGKVQQYSDKKQRTDDLFFEYARLLRGLQPKVFVAENVSGLIKGAAKGYFIEILAALKDCGYTVEAKLLDAQWLGVPQSRQRLIFVGVRKDLKLRPVFPKPLPYNYSVRDALPWIVRHQYVGHAYKAVWGDADTPAHTILGNGSFSKKIGQFMMCEAIVQEPPVEPETSLEGYSIGKLWEEIEPGETHPIRFNLRKPALDKPCPTVLQSMGNEAGKVRHAANVVHPLEKRYFSIAEVKRLCSFPDDYVLTGTFAKQWERLGRAVPPVMMAHIARTIATEVLGRL